MSKKQHIVYICLYMHKSVYLYIHMFIHIHVLIIPDLQNHASSPLNKHNRTLHTYAAFLKKGFLPDRLINRCSWEQKAAVLRVINTSPLCPGWLGRDVGLGRSMFHHPSLRIRLYVLGKGFPRTNPMTWGWDVSTKINPTRNLKGSEFLGPYVASV